MLFRVLRFFQSFVNLDSDDSGHDEPKSQRSDECKNVALVNDAAKSTEENNVEMVAANDGAQTEEIKSIESKQADEIRKTPPSKRDILVRKLKHKLKYVRCNFDGRLCLRSIPTENFLQGYRRREKRFEFIARNV